jgi:tetratricopeptide (TPR) repeat protein
MKLFGKYWGKKSYEAANYGHYKIHSHAAEYLSFLLPFFTDYEDIKNRFKFENEPNNLNGLVNFALFLDFTTNLPHVFTESNTIDMKGIIDRFVKNYVNAIPKLCRIFKDTQIDQTIGRLMFYAHLLRDDLNNRATCNYQTVHEFLKEVFSGQITEEEKTVLTNMLAVKLSPVKALILMQASSINVKNSEILQKTSNDDTEKSTYCHEIIGQKTLNADDYFKRGVGYLFSDNIKAINDFTQAIALDINHKDSYLQRGIAFYELNQFKDALSDCKKAREIDTTSQEALSQMGNCYIELQEYELARRCFLLCLLQNPRSPLYHYKYGVAFSRLKNYDAAIESFFRAIKFGCESPDIYFERGSALYNLNGYDEFALKDFQHYLKYRPDDYRCHYSLACIYNRLKEYEKSLEYMTKTISLNPTWSEPYKIRGITNRVLNHDDDAMKDFSKAIEINSEDVKSYILRSKLYKEKGNYCEAKQDLLHVLRIDPDNIEAKEKLMFLESTKSEN